MWRVVVSAIMGIAVMATVSGVTAGIPLQQPDPQHDGHKVRPDGQACKTTGDDACHCAIRVCTEDDKGNVTSYDMTSACQWFCHKDHCTCHPCLDECPKPDGS